MYKSGLTDVKVIQGIVAVVTNVRHEALSLCLQLAIVSAVANAMYQSACPHPGVNEHGPVVTEQLTHKAVSVCRMQSK